MEEADTLISHPQRLKLSSRSLDPELNTEAFEQPYANLSRSLADGNEVFQEPSGYGGA